MTRDEMINNINKINVIRKLKNKTKIEYIKIFNEDNEDINIMDYSYNKDLQIHYSHKKQNYIFKDCIIVSTIYNYIKICGTYNIFELLDMKSKLFKNNFIDGSDDYGYQIYNYHCSKEEKFKIINQLLLTILNNESLSI